MSTTRASYLSIANDYAEAAKSYFEVVKAIGTTRGEMARASASELLTRAKSALPKSVAFNEVIEPHLSTVALEDAEQADAASQILAKAITDLSIGKDLLDVAADKDGEREVGVSTTRSAHVNDALQDALRGITATSTKRDIAVGDIPTAKTKLTTRVEDTLHLISSRSTSACQKIVDNELSMTFSTVVQGAGSLFQDAATWLGQGDTVNQLIDWAKRFLAQGYEALLKLIGKPGLDIAQNKVVAWLKDLIDKKNELIGSFIEKRYHTKDTQSKLNSDIAASTADLQHHVNAINAVDILNSGFGRYVKLVDQAMGLLPGLAKGVALFQIPQAQAAIAAFYALAFGVVLLVGGAFVDSPEFQILSNIKGVKDLVDLNLAA